MNPAAANLAAPSQRFDVMRRFTYAYRALSLDSRKDNFILTNLSSLGQ
jgi:hypothetical protein